MKNGKSKKESVRRVFNIQEKRDILVKTNCKCAHCGRTIDEYSMTVEHIFPVSRGGDNSEFNLVALCENCNNNKSNFVYSIYGYYGHILDEYKKDYQRLLAKNNIKYNKSNDFANRIYTVTVLSKQGGLLIYKMLKRGQKIKDDLTKRLEINLEMELAYPASSERIANLVNKYGRDCEINIDTDYYGNKYNILNEIRAGSKVFEISDKNSTCGAVIFKKIPDSIKELPQIKSIEQNTVYKARYALSLVIFNNKYVFDYSKLIRYCNYMLIKNYSIPIYYDLLREDNTDEELYNDLIKPVISIDGKDIEVQIEGIKSLRKREIHMAKRFAYSLEEKGIKLSEDEIVKLANVFLRLNTLSDSNEVKQVLEDEDFVNKYDIMAEVWNEKMT